MKARVDKTEQDNRCKLCGDRDKTINHMSKCSKLAQKRAAQKNTIRTNHFKARIDKTQQNSRYRLCGDRDKTINHIISKCSKLAQKD